MKLPKYLAIAAILGAVLGPCGLEFFYFVSATTADWFDWVGDLCLVPLLLLSLGALIKLRWKWVAICAVAWSLIILPPLGFHAPYNWLSQQGFRTHTLLDQNYLSRCRLTDVVENGKTQQVGFCEHFDHLEICDFIMYDTAGQFVLPASRRTPEWKQAIAAVAVNSLVSPDDNALHLFGGFYRVITLSGPGCML
jgi:hypothetical protein